ncbi:MAG: hypothetical protein NTW21_14920 [Verrucomicrobia bacterium]|nr:hypothetical protein [Verrucomicrobiota bacterium]
MLRLAHWILFAVACNVAGWALSLVGQLHAVGLVVAIPLVWWLLARAAGLGRPTLPGGRCMVRWRRRLVRPLPAVFALLGLLSLVGGLGHPPNNFDALIYRLPRVCDWLMAGHWEWIPTIKNNLNTRSTGFEWWLLPMIGILRTDRLIFMLNLVCFLFMPGAIFGLMRGFGVARRVAAVWMWVLPAGYCFVLQAASVGNDMMTSLFAVAAFDFGFRWRRGGGFASLAMALLSCAMMTAVKPTTLPLLLPFAVLFFGMWKPAVARWRATCVLLLGGGIASFLPTAAINVAKCGDWTGAAAEDRKLGSVEPLIGMVGNTINATLQNFVPPVFPMAGAWNRFFVSLFPPAFLQRMEGSFEPAGARFILPDFTGEEGASLGMGVTMLLLVSVPAAWCLGRGMAVGRVAAGRTPRWLLAGLFGIALAAYFSRAGMSTVGRHIAPYYPFLAGILLLGTGHVRLVRTRWWKVAALAAVGTAMVMVIITPSRPLWPAQWFFGRFGVGTDSGVIQRAHSGYAVYADRADGLGVLRDALPGEATRVGFLSFGITAELPLWKPYLKRRLRHVFPGETAASVRADGVSHLVINTYRFKEVMGVEPVEWLGTVGGEVVFRTELQLLVKAPPSEWWVARLPSPLPVDSSETPHPALPQP